MTESVTDRQLGEMPRWWRSGSLFDRLSGPARTDLIRLGSPRTFPDGQVIIREGVKDRHVILLRSGFVKVVCASLDGQSLLAIRTAGDVVGELAAISAQPRSATIVAAGKVASRVIVQDVFRLYLQRHPEVSEHLIAMLAGRLAFANQRRIDFTTQPILNRLSQIIITLADTCGEPGPGGGVEIKLPITHTELGSLIGASEAAIQQALGKMRGLDLIATGYRRITVLNGDGLGLLAIPPE